jgi:hypothetical protein
LSRDALEVRIEAAARDHIRARGGAVTLRGSRRHGCCGGTAFVPVAEVGVPAEPERYVEQQVGSVTVYLQPGMMAGSAPLVVGLDVLGRWRRLRVEGSAIWM